MFLPSKINLQAKFTQIEDHWHPRIIAELHGLALKIVKLKGEFEWHFHENEDELFWVINGELLIHFRGETITLTPGEMLLIPHGVEHKPEAPEEVEVVLLEPKETLNTGNIRSERTIHHPENL